MEIKFTQAQTLKEKPDPSTLGFGKIFTDYMFMMDWNNKQVGRTQELYPLAIFRYILHRPASTTVRKFLRDLKHIEGQTARFSFSDRLKTLEE